MSILFSASEVVTMAVQIEKNGLEFYSKMAKKAQTEKSKELFKFLAAEEVRHAATFQKMLNSLKQLELTASEEEEYNNYLGALTSSRVFNREVNTDEIVKNLDDATAIDLAIEAEKDSILFYYELMEQAMNEDRAAIEKVIKEEKSHYAMLMRMKNES